jgi:hypothetical protein
MPLTFCGVHLLTQESEFSRRVQGNSQPFIVYLKQVRAALGQYYATWSGPPIVRDVLTTVAPPARCRSWLVARPDASRPPESEEVLALLAPIPAPPCEDRPILFAQTYTVAAEAFKAALADFRLPQELFECWDPAAGALDMDTFADRLWARNR